MSKKEAVVILGASDKKNRYSYKAYKMLQEYGHQVYLVHHELNEVEGTPCYKTLLELQEKNKEIRFDTLTVYVNPAISSQLKKEIVNFNAKRVIFNPGTENDDVSHDLLQKGIDVEESCTLVLLSTGQF